MLLKAHQMNVGEKEDEGSRFSWIKVDEKKEILGEEERRRRAEESVVVEVEQ